MVRSPGLQLGRLTVASTGRWLTRVPVSSVFRFASKTHEGKKRQPKLCSYLGLQTACCIWLSR